MAPDGTPGVSAANGNAVLDFLKCGLSACGTACAERTQDQLVLELAERVLERPCGSMGCAVPQGREYVDTDEFLAAL